MTATREVDALRLFHELTQKRGAAQIWVNSGLEEQLWDVIKGDNISYELTFETVLEGQTFESYIARRRDQGKKTFILDAMSYGAALRTLPTIDGGLSVALTDPRTDDQRVDDAAKNLFVTQGNLFAGKTLREISDWIALQNPDERTFHAILCRPFKGYDYIPNDPATHMDMLQRGWNLLSFNDGLLLTQVPSSSKPFLASWVDRVNKYSGIKARYSFYGRTGQKLTSPVLKLIKSAHAPARLPIRS